MCSGADGDVCGDDEITKGHSVMRKSIFQIIEENDNLERKMGRIVQLFEKEPLIDIRVAGRERAYTIKEVIDAGFFSSWKQRGFCLDLDEFLEMLEFDDLCTNDDFESYLIVIEVVYNLWMLIHTRMYVDEEESGQTASKSFMRVKEMLDEYLSQCNHKAIYYPEEEKVLIIEDNAAVSAAAEVVENTVAKEILRYNHYSLKGDLKSKKEILRNLGDYLESNERTLSRIDSTLKNAIFHVLNKMGIRHKNAANDDNVAKVGDKLEYWYDELYQMMLLAILRIDNDERMKKYSQELKPLLL